MNEYREGLLKMFQVTQLVQACHVSRMGPVYRECNHLQDCDESIEGMGTLGEVFDQKTECRGPEYDVRFKVKVKINL